MIDIAILEQLEWKPKLTKLAESLELPFVQSRHDAKFILHLDQEGKLAISAISAGQKAIYVEMKPLGSAQGKDPLMKAIGYKTNSVFDATAGWATDAMHMATHGIQVNACERNPIIHALVADGLSRSMYPDISMNLTLQYGESAECMKHLNPAPEVVYLDPMYPKKNGSAAPKKSLQLLRDLYQLPRYFDPHAAQNEAELLELARETAVRRVVVKRPHYAPPLAPGASGAIAGKLVRFDIYPPR